MDKARKEVNKSLEGVSNNDKFQNDEDRELYSGFVNNPLETDNSTEDSETNNKEKNLPAAMLNSLLKINNLDDFSTELQSAQNKYLFRTFDIDALRLHQENLENRESKKQSTTTTTRTQKVNNNPNSGTVNEALNKPGVVIQKDPNDVGSGPAASESEAFSASSFLTEAALDTINKNHKDLIASFDSYSEELSKAGFNNVEQLEALQDPIERKKIFRLICKKK
jgi:hypothetical protein